MVGRVAILLGPGLFFRGKTCCSFQGGFCHFSPSPGMIPSHLCWDLEDLKACQSWKSFSPMLDWVTVPEAQPQLRDFEGFSGFCGERDFEQRHFVKMKFGSGKWNVPGNSAKVPFWGMVKLTLSKVVNVTNPTFGDEVRSRRLNHLVSKILWVRFSDCRVIKKSLFRVAEMMTLNLPQVLLGKSWPQRRWVPPLGTMNPRNPPAKCWKESFRFFRNSSDFFRNLLKKILDHKTRFSFHFVLYRKDLGPSNGRVWTCIPGVFWSSK